MLLSSPRGQAANDNDNNGAQDEKLMIQIGKSAAPVQLNLAAKDSDMVYLGSFLVNVAGDCNGCHTADPSTEYLPPGNPYLRTPPNGPFLGKKIIDPAHYREAALFSDRSPVLTLATRCPSSPAT